MKFFRRDGSELLAHAPPTVLTLGEQSRPAETGEQLAPLQPGKQHLWHQQIAAWAALTVACLCLPLHYAFASNSHSLLAYGVYLLLAAWFGLIAAGLQTRHFALVIWGQRVLVALAIPWACVQVYALHQGGQPILLLLWPVIGVWLLLLTTSPWQWLLCVLLALPGLYASARFGENSGFASSTQAIYLVLMFSFLLAASVQMAHLRRRVGVVRQRVAEREAHLHAKADRMRRLALRDALTGLSNRLHLMARLRRVLEHGSRRYDGATLFLIDLDHFKDINDRFGHDAGDAVLIAVAQRLRSLVRHEDLVCRLGGDEFVLLVEGQLLPQHAEQLASKILQSLAEPCRHEGRILPLGGSVGVAPLHPGIRQPESWLKEADAAMYIAKHGGRNRFAFAAAATPGGGEGEYPHKK